MCFRFNRLSGLCTHIFIHIDIFDKLIIAFTIQNIEKSEKNLPYTAENVRVVSCILPNNNYGRCGSTPVCRQCPGDFCEIKSDFDHTLAVKNFHLLLYI